MDIWFTSDLHLCHDKAFLWSPRGFKDQFEMNEAIVENWNKVVKKDDIVYDLGDLALTDLDTAISVIKRLNGTHYWILGNHDTKRKVDAIMEQCPKVWEEGYAHVLKEDKYSFYLSHYPTLTANFDDKKFSRHVINLHGHTHQRTNWLQDDNPFMYHVGMDSHNCTPVNLEEILSDVRQRWEEIGKLPQPVKLEDIYEVR